MDGGYNSDSQRVVWRHDHRQILARHSRPQLIGPRRPAGVKRLSQDATSRIRDETLLERDPSRADVGLEDAAEPFVVGKSVERAMHMDGVADADTASRWIEARERRRRKPVESHREP